jgi:glycosyltransferase involved in cell wall biosynthesis
MNMPLVSVIIPTFNRPEFLRAAVSSVLAQDYPAKEIIVVDDGSSGETAEACAQMPVLYLQQGNKGPSAARNLGAASAQGDLFCFLDDDDLCPPGTLRVRVEQWQRDPSYDHVVGRLQRFREDESGVMEFVDTEEEAGKIICSGAEVMTRRAFENAGGYDESLRLSEDTDLWSRIREAGFRQRFIPEICLFNRQHPGKITMAERSVAMKGLVNALHLKVQRNRMRQNNTGETP